MTVTEQGRQAVTHYYITRQYQDYTLLEVQLMTGRTHQIRVHMAYINHPVVGDPLYGGRMRIPANADDTFIGLLQQFNRQALHAQTISFYHPKTDQELTFEAPIPEDFNILLNAMDRHYGY